LLVASCASVAALRQVFGSNAAIVAPDFTLIDQNAQPFTLSELRGHPVAFFFGYTHCPDECPGTLQRLAKALRAPGVPRDIRIAFITVDPSRDSPLVLKRYVRIFDPNFIGLTGSSAALNRVYAGYHIPLRAAPAGRAQNAASIEHGTTIFYVGRDGAIKSYGHWDDTTLEIAESLRGFQ
jgi:protein SCO1/2